jgi:hypothetical protein
LADNSAHLKIAFISRTNTAISSSAFILVIRNVSGALVANDVRSFQGQGNLNFLTGWQALSHSPSIVDFRTYFARR